MDFSETNAAKWMEALAAYPTRIEALGKPNLHSLDQFYRLQLPSVISERNPSPYITQSELHKVLQWKLARGKWRPRLLEFVKSLDDKLVRSASQKAFKAIPNIRNAISELTVLKGIGPATASAVLSAYSPDFPFMSDEAMEAALGNSREYTLKQFVTFAEALQQKAMELSSEVDCLTASDVERALWSASVYSKLQSTKGTNSSSKKRKR